MLPSLQWHVVTLNGHLKSCYHSVMEDVESRSWSESTMQFAKLLYISLSPVRWHTLLSIRSWCGRLVSRVIRGTCRRTRRFGNMLDGGYDVCVVPQSVKPTPGNCLVYSFGLARLFHRWTYYGTLFKFQLIHAFNISFVVCFFCFFFCLFSSTAWCHSYTEQC